MDFLRFIISFSYMYVNQSKTLEIPYTYSLKNNIVY
jgi:hypothetical protein